MSEKGARLLTRCNESQIKGVPGGRSTNPDTLRPSDIAAGLSGLPAGVSATVLLKHCHDPASVRPLYAHLLNTAGKLAVEQRWKGYRANEKPAAKMLESMVRLAIDELMRSGVCPSCRGSKRSVNDKRACQRCGGTGRQNYSDRERARMVGMPRTTWRDTWARRYEQIYSVANSWDKRAERHVVRKVGL